MLTEVMEHFHLVREFRKTGYYETEQQKQMFKDIKVAIHSVRAGGHNRNYRLWKNNHFATFV